MKIHTFPLGPLETNAYLLVQGNEAVAVDIGGDPAALTRYLDKHTLRLTRILTTHLHFDHVLGNAALSAQTGAPVYASSKDDYLLRSETGSGGMFGLPKVPPFAFDPLEESKITLMGLPCTVLATPGHTPGSLSYYFSEDNALFSGDVLFYRSVGRTDLPGGDGHTLHDSIANKLFVLPPQTVVYPGHGPETTIGDEKRGNPYVRM